MKRIRNVIAAALIAAVASCAKKSADQGNQRPAVPAASGPASPSTSTTPAGGPSTEPEDAGSGSGKMVDGGADAGNVPVATGSAAAALGEHAVSVWNHELPELKVENLFEPVDTRHLAELGIDERQVGKSIRSEVFEGPDTSSVEREVTAQKLKASPLSVVVHASEARLEVGKKFAGFILAYSNSVKFLAVADMTATKGSNGTDFAFKVDDVEFKTTEVYVEDSSVLITPQNRYHQPPNPIEGLKVLHGAAPKTISASWRFAGGPATHLVVVLREKSDTAPATCERIGALYSSTFDPLAQAGSVPLPDSVSSEGKVVTVTICAVNGSGVSAPRSADYTVGRSDGYFGLVVTSVELKMLRPTVRDENGRVKRLPVLAIDGTPLVRAIVRDLIARFDIQGNLHLFFLMDDEATPQISRLIHAVGQGDPMLFRQEIVGPPFPRATRLNQALIKNL